MGTTYLRHIISLALLLYSSIAMAGISLSFSGQDKKILNESPASSTGLDAIYVLASVNGVSATYSATSSNVKWYKWNIQGAAYATEIPSSNITKVGKNFTLSAVDGDCGYTIEDGASTHYFWIVDYSRHKYTISSVAIGDGSDCSMTELVTQGNANPIYYYSINARAYEIDREIHVTYSTLTPEPEALAFNQVIADETVSHISGTVHVPSPLCNTSFKISGDKFLTLWGSPIECSTPSYATNAVDAVVRIEQKERENDNEQSVEKETTTLGGSAPCEIKMEAAVSDGAIFHEWQITSDPSFNDVLLRANELEYIHTFSDMGTYYIRFVCADATGKCEWTSDIYTVFIGESRLLCPNAFSPNASPGVNDEWKVSYRSLVSFECHIFNKWGVKVAELKDPSQGWDGKHGGKFVPAGVYYYVIKAEGADGVKYNLSGDINIVNYK